MPVSFSKASKYALRSAVFIDPPEALTTICFGFGGSPWAKAPRAVSRAAPAPTMTSRRFSLIGVMSSPPPSIRGTAKSISHHVTRTGGIQSPGLRRSCQSASGRSNRCLDAGARVLQLGAGQLRGGGRSTRPRSSSLGDELSAGGPRSDGSRKILLLRLELLLADIAPRVTL